MSGTSNPTFQSVAAAAPGQRNISPAMADLIVKYAIQTALANAGSSSTTSASTTGTVAAATGTTQGGAAALPYANNVVLAVPSGSGVILGAVFPCLVINQGTSNLNVYPQAGAQVNQIGTNTAAQIAPGGSATFVETSSTQLYAGA